MENKHIVIGGAIIIVIILILLLFLPRDTGPKLDEETIQLNQNQQAQTPELTQLQYQDVKVGTGSAEVAAGDTITVHYVGSLLNNQVFDSSRERNQPFEVTIGARQVIPGFEQGVLGMREGGVRIIRIPSDLAYGVQGAGAIPPNTSVQFEVEVLTITKADEVTPSVPAAEPEEETPTPTESETP